MGEGTWPKGTIGALQPPVKSATAGQMGSGCCEDHEASEWKSNNTRGSVPPDALVGVGKNSTGDKDLLNV
ncbi:hypothetical protein EYF80_044841 [Liparis tanakae]|uniref:Uncharacterized protein n=1 Tax=Liparis tanakae TaxID=230148 RepID=A0A4Z2FUU8_9TELE|nr:hypothetical protein EYF80_044841 [Liparis tanakae]